MLFFFAISCASDLIRLRWFFFSHLSLLLLCCQTSQVTVSIGTALRSRVASTRSKSRRKCRGKTSPALVLLPPPEILLLSQVLADEGAERRWLGMTEVLVELSVGRGCWAADMPWPDHGSRKNLNLTGLGWKRVTVSGMLAPSLTRQLCLFWQRWSTWNKWLSRRGWFEHNIPHPLWFLESKCVEPNFAAWRFSLLFRFSWKPLYSPPRLGKDGNGGCKVLMKLVLLLWPTASL